jgi:hypothetical protein
MHVHEALKAVEYPYSFIYLNYFEIMSGFASFIVIRDHNWFVHLTIFLVSSIKPSHI